MNNTKALATALADRLFTGWKQITTRSTLGEDESEKKLALTLKLAELRARELREGLAGRREERRVQQLPSTNGGVYDIVLASDEHDIGAAAQNADHFAQRAAELF